MMTSRFFSVEPVEITIKFPGQNSGYGYPSAKRQTPRDLQTFR